MRIATLPFDAARCASAALRIVVCLATMLFLPSFHTAQAHELIETIIAVEEDWEISIGCPDLERNAPQLTTIMSPTGDLDAHYMAFVLNHKSLPDYEPGGMQMQVWLGEEVWDCRDNPLAGMLATENEVICWTQSMRLTEGSLEFEIKSGTSGTWGAFGGQGYLRTSFSTQLTDLNCYTPAVSLEHSGAGFAGNRVAGMVLKRVRWYSAAGLVAECSTPLVVHECE